MRQLIMAFLMCMVLVSRLQAQSLLSWPEDGRLERGNVVFIHPDGTSLAHWGAARIRWVGPDGTLNWDRLPHAAVYRSHMLDTLGPSSHAGGTVHAYGIKVPVNSFGMAGESPITSLSGKPQSIMQEAQQAGRAVGIVNSGSLVEPGTACFLVSVPSRGLYEEIVGQTMRSGAQVIMGGGEPWLLPAGTKGRHGAEGKRSDGRNLVTEAQAAGYAVVYDRAELLALPAATTRVLGVFAAGATFNDQPEEKLTAAGLPLYVEGAPTLAEMTSAALRILSADTNGFFLVVEEEGTDNFSNYANGKGALEALRRADDAIGVVRTFRETNPDTLLVTAADSDASGMQVIAVGNAQAPLSATTSFGAPLDGVDGTGTAPFLSGPDQFGRQHAFGVGWIAGDDTSGGILCRAEGPNAELLDGGHADNTDIYRLIYATLFGKRL